MMFSPQQHTEHFVISNVIYKNGEKTENRNPFFHSAATRFKKMRSSKIAKLVNAPAIHNQKIIVRSFQIPPAAHRAHRGFAPAASSGLVFPPAAPTEPSQVLCLVRACLPPSSTQSTLSFNGIYKNREKTEVGYSFFTQLHIVSKKKCGFRKLRI